MDSLRISDQLRERPALLAVIATDWIRNILIRIVSLGIDQNQRHQLPRLLHRERPEQQFVDLAKDRRVRSDAEREREHRHGGEAGVLQHLAEGEAKVVHRMNGWVDRWIIGSMEVDTINPFIQQSSNPDRPAPCLE